MGSAIFATFLPVALGLVMLGLGLTLTLDDFARVVRHPKAVFVALACQMIVLPLVCLGLVLAFGLQGALAAGMMLLVASPGGTSSSLFSHLAGGDVALNITLTAVNSVLAVFTLPVVVGFSMTAFMGEGASIGLQPAKFLQVFAIVLVPVAVGMWFRRRWTSVAERMRGLVRIASSVVLGLTIVVALVQQFQVFLDNVARLGPATLLLCAVSLSVGYWVPKLVRLTRGESIASAMEIGLHNAALAITIAISVIGDETIALPAAMYGTIMFLPAAVTVRFLARRTAAVSFGQTAAMDR